MDNPPEQPHPQRLSALYQYHNAPEVAPAHGLEYDDSNYPSSDKYPVVHGSSSYGGGGGGKWSGSKGFGHDTKPPRIIFGMKTKTFLVVAAIMIMVIVGAAVGGAVGGSSIKNNTSEYTPSNSSATATSTTAPTTPSAFSAPTPNYTPLNDCPKSNNTIYSSSFASGFRGAIQSNAKLNFTRYCDVASPISLTSTQSSTFVYSFEDCIEACAGSNFYGNNAACTVAVFQASASRPANCWTGSSNSTNTPLATSSGIDVALLNT